MSQAGGAEEDFIKLNNAPGKIVKHPITVFDFIGRLLKVFL